VLRVMVDWPGSETKFLVLGSASPDLLLQSSELLAGWIDYHRLHGLASNAVGPTAPDRLCLRLRGGTRLAGLQAAAERRWFITRQNVATASGLPSK
jgi:hypothetical protein